MNEERKQILEMLSEGRLTAVEAERLLVALGNASTSENVRPVNDTSARTAAKYLRVIVESDDDHAGTGAASNPIKVNIRVPMRLLRAGVKLASLVPAQARDHVNDALREHGVQLDLSQIKPENLEELVDHLNDLTVDVDEKSTKVRIFCE